MRVMALAALVAASQAAGSALRSPWETASAWVAAVETHRAGRSDAAVGAVLGIKTAELESAFTPLSHALAEAIEMDGRSASFDELLRPYASRQLKADERQRRDALSERIATFGVDRFLKRAALLHADLAIVAPFSHLTQSQGLGHLAADGQHAGSEGRPWHWMLARSFLHLVRDISADSDARLWYQAAGAHMLAERNFTEAAPHIDRGLTLFPADAEMHFLDGLMHEAQAAADIQASLADQIAQLPRQPRSIYTPAIRSADDERREARDAYDAALESDPDHVEARVHRARVRLADEQYEGAASDARRVLSRPLPPVLEYYARLFLGKAEQMQGRADSARAAFERAASLFPDAQAPRLSLAEVELQSGNREAARALLAFLAEVTRKDEPGEDPLWEYHRMRVPPSSAWLERMWAQFKELDR